MSLEGRLGKLHAACDECRTRKLKCSGDEPQCARCAQENLKCIYSPRKQMGRPKKRRRADWEQETQETDLALISQLPEDDVIEACLNLGNELQSPATYGPLSMATAGESPFATAEYAGADALQNVTVLEGSSQEGVEHHAAQYQQPAGNIFPLLDPSYKDYSTVDLDMSIDPSLWPQRTTLTPSSLPIAQVNASPPDTAPCSCLAIMYLSLSQLQSLSDFSFPVVISPLREALKTVDTILHCEKCCLSPFTTTQNIQSCSALLSAIAERFHRVLHAIDTEADRLVSNGEKKPFRIGDSNPALHHLHTGKEDCPMGFTIELEAQDWAKFAKKALKAEIYGGGSNTRPMVTIIDEWEARQKRWHLDSVHMEERKRIYGDCKNLKPGDAMCLRMVGNVRNMVDNMKWE